MGGGKKQVAEKCMSCLNSLWGAASYFCLLDCCLCLCACTCVSLCVLVLRLYACALVLFVCVFYFWFGLVWFGVVWFGFGVAENKCSLSGWREKTRWRKSACPV